jgi:O-antigen/teichoic acid export membrane protein
MAKIDWKKNFVRNTLSSYAATICSMGLGLVMFRLLFSTWSDPEYGFWALMWSMFGFGVVLDFGLGIGVQRTVSANQATGDTEGMNRLVSTVFWSFVGLAAIVLVVGLALRVPILGMLKDTEGYYEEISLAFIYFTVGLTIMFPLGLFQEMLQGIQRLDITNWIRVASSIANIIFVGGAVIMGFKFSTVILVAMLLATAPGIISAVYTFKHIPGLSLNPRNFDFKEMKSQLGFSLSAYFVTVSDRIIQQSDRVIVGTFLGLGAVAMYQAAVKMAEMLRFSALHIEELLSPAASHLSANDDQEGVKDLLLRGSRFNFVFVTPLYLLSAVYLDPLIRLLTGMNTLPHETWIVGQLLLFAVYNSQIASNCARSVLVMSGHEKVLFKISIAHAISNVVLSIILVKGFQSIGVAAATVATSVIFGWIVLMPKILRTIRVSFGEYIGFHFQGVLPGFAIFAVILLPLAFLMPMPADVNLFVALAWRGALVMVPTLFLSYKVMKTTWAQ